MRPGGFGIEKEIDLHRAFEEALRDHLDAIAELVLDPIELEAIGCANLQATLIGIELAGGQGFDPRGELLRRQFIAKLFRTGAPKIVHRISVGRGIGSCGHARGYGCVGLFVQFVAARVTSSVGADRCEELGRHVLVDFHGVARCCPQTPRTKKPYAAHS